MIEPYRDQGVDLIVGMESRGVIFSSPIAYQLHAGIYRRICSNGLVLSQDSFEAIRFRHAGLLGDEVVQASFRLLDFVPRVGELVQKFRSRSLDAGESRRFAEAALLLRYPSLAEAPIEPDTLLKARRPEDEGTDLWTTTNKVQEALIRGGGSDFHRDRHGKLRSVRLLRGIDSKVRLNKGLWGWPSGWPMANRWSCRPRRR